MDEATQELLSAIQAKIRRNEDPTDDELRTLILTAREGRRAAAEGQKTSRKKAVPISLMTLFKQ